MSNFIKKLEQKVGIDDLLERIQTKLTGSEFNSLLLALYKKRTADLKPAEVLNAYQQNRFVVPSKIDPVQYKQEEIRWLNKAQEREYQSIQLSPLAPLGTSSVFGFVDQNRIVSATRGCEIVSDATNVLAMHIAQEFKSSRDAGLLRFCTTQRFTRAQQFSDPRFTAHFGIYCMVSGGLTEAGKAADTTMAIEHIKFYFDMLVERFDIADLSLDLEYGNSQAGWVPFIKEAASEACPGMTIHTRNQLDGTSYYQKLRFRLYLDLDGDRINLADGGFVDWMQQMLSNKKLRMMISGIGLEMAHNLGKAGAS